MQLFYYSSLSGNVIIIWSYRLIKRIILLLSHKNSVYKFKDFIKMMLIKDNYKEFIVHLDLFIKSVLSEDLKINYHILLNLIKYKNK